MLKSIIALLVAVPVLAMRVQNIPPEYRVTVLADVAMEPTGINASGQVVGIAAERGLLITPFWGFVWKEGKAQPIPGLTSDLWANIRAINKNSVAVGYGQAKPGAGDRALIFKDGKTVELPIDDSGFDPKAAAWAINDSETVAGTAKIKNTEHAVTWQDGKLRDLGDLGGGFSFALGINNRGVVVGRSNASSKPGDETWHAFIYKDGKMSKLESPFKHGGCARAVNDQDSVAVDFETGETTAPELANAATHACVWKDGKVTDLGTLGGRWSRIGGINNRGEVVGTSALNDGKTHGFLYTGGKMLDLDGTVSKEFGWTIVGAAAINDSGQIAAVAQKGEKSVAVLLTPKK